MSLMAAPDLVGLAESPANFVNATAPIGVAFGDGDTSGRYGGGWRSLLG